MQLLAKLAGNYGMDDEILKQLKENQVLLEKTYKTVERLKKYFMWTLIITVITVILPIIGLMFLLPTLMGSLGGGILGL